MVIDHMPDVLSGIPLTGETVLLCMMGMVVFYLLISSVER